MSRGSKIAAAFILVAVVMIAVIAITRPSSVKTVTDEDRLASIPASAVKQTPELDGNKSVVLSDLWNQPVPMAGPVNTAGAEDSPFITLNGTWFFFFFTPDVSVPAEKQLIDGVTGIWWTQKVNGSWTAPTKIVLNDDVSLDGAECVVGSRMWFGSVRAGNLGEIDVYYADFKDGKWTDVKNAGRQLNVDYDIGEFHLTPDGNTLYFHKDVSSSDRDLFVSHWDGSAWTTPEPLTGINTPGSEGWPYVTPDGSEVWWTAWSAHGYQGPAIWRSVKQPNGSWGPHEEIIGNFAGECTLDSEGNIYFVHHFFNGTKMLEADIYMASRK